MKRKVCVVVTARPSYARIRSALEAIRAHEALELQLVVAASALLEEMLLPEIAAKRAEPGDDLGSSLVQAEVEGERLSDHEVVSFLRLLIVAGAGFAGASAIHNATHDTRHAFGLPCH